MKDDQAQAFNMSNTMAQKLKKWYIQVQPTSDVESKEEIAKKNKGSKIVEEQVPKKKEVKKVKCLCVNGTCAEGDYRCEKCYPGFEGVLCDIRTSSYNRTGMKNKIAEQDEVDDVVFRQGKKNTKIQDERDSSQTD